MLRVLQCWQTISVCTEGSQVDVTLTGIMRLIYTGHVSDHIHLNGCRPLRHALLTYLCFGSSLDPEWWQFGEDYYMMLCNPWWLAVMHPPTLASFFAHGTLWLRLLYIFITREFRYLGLRKAPTPKYLDQVNLTLKMFQWPWFHSYNTFGSKLILSEYLVHLNHTLTPTFEHFDTIRPRGPPSCLGYIT